MQPVFRAIIELNASLGGTHTKFDLWFVAALKRKDNLQASGKLELSWKVNLFTFQTYLGAAVSCGFCDLKKLPHEPIRVIVTNSSFEVESKELRSSQCSTLPKQRNIS